MENKTIVSFEIAIAAKERGFNEPCLSAYDENNNLNICDLSDLSSHFNANYPISNKEIKEATNIKWMFKKGSAAPNYHELVEWIFSQHFLTDGWRPSYSDPDNSGLHPEAEPDIKAYTEHYEFWYNLLKDSPLKYEFKGRLMKWFRYNNAWLEIVWMDTLSDLCYYHISSTGNAIRPNSSLMHGYETVEHEGILKIFELLKK